MDAYDDEIAKQIISTTSTNVALTEILHCMIHITKQNCELFEKLDDIHTELVHIESGINPR